MGFLKPQLPEVDIAEWSKGTRSEKIRPMARHWAEVGFGTPVAMHLFYVAKILLYILMGWSGLVAFRPIADHLPPMSMLLIVIGGIIYTIGVIFHVWQRLRFQNAIWHGFVVTAAAIHYAAVLMAV